MDRLNQGSLLSGAHGAYCETLEIQAQALAAAQAAGKPTPTPQERLARIMQTIETDIVPRLVRAHRQTVEVPVQSAIPLTVMAADVSLLVKLSLAEDDAGWQHLLEGLLGRGVPVEDIYLNLLAPCAADLGRLWDDDLLPFTEVTVALGRLQRMMRWLSPAFSGDIGQPADGRRVLLLAAPGELHTFGLSIVAEFFRRAGWEVVGDSEARAADPAALVRSEWFDVIGISVGHVARMDWLKSGIAAVRAASRNRGIGVLVGGPVFSEHPERAAEVGADGTALNGSQAPVVAEQLLAGRAHRL